MMLHETSFLNLGCKLGEVFSRKQKEKWGLLLWESSRTVMGKVRGGPAVASGNFI